MAKFCTNCGNPVEEGAAFCGRCGHQFGAFVPPPAGAYVPPPQNINPAAGAKKKFPLLPAAALLLVVVLVTGFLYPGWIKDLLSGGSPAGSGEPTVGGSPTVEGDPAVEVGSAGSGQLKKRDLVGKYKGTTTAAYSYNDEVDEYDIFEYDIISVDGDLKFVVQLKEIPLDYDADTSTCYGMEEKTNEDGSNEETMVDLKAARNPDGSIHLSGTVIFFSIEAGEGESGSIITFSLELDSVSSNGGGGLTVDVGSDESGQLKKRDLVGKYKGTTISTYSYNDNVDKYDIFEYDIISVDGDLKFVIQLKEIPLSYSADTGTCHGMEQETKEDGSNEGTMVDLKAAKNPDGSVHLSGTVIFFTIEAGESEAGTTITLTLELDSVSS